MNNFTVKTLLFSAAFSVALFANAQETEKTKETSAKLDVKEEAKKEEAKKEEPKKEEAKKEEEKEEGEKKEEVKKETAGKDKPKKEEATEETAGKDEPKAKEEKKTAPTEDEKNKTEKPCDCKLCPHYKEDAHDCKHCPRHTAHLHKGEENDELAAKWKVLDSTMKLKLYGFIKFDGYWNNSAVYNADSPLWVKSEAEGKENKNSIGFQGRATRIGLSLDVPELAGSKTGAGGVLETDFYGNFPYSSVSTGQPQLRLRLAYLHLDWRYLSLIAGNAWMFASPLNPKTLNFLIFAGMGNLWVRLPIFGLKTRFPLGNAANLYLDAGVAKPIAGDGPRNTEYDSGGAGEFGGMPMLQGRLALGSKIWGEKESSLGFSASYHKENHLYNNEAPVVPAQAYNEDDYKLDAYFFSGELSLNLGGHFALEGEIFSGKNLDSFYGGILQGVSADGLTGIRTSGGWVNGVVYPTKELALVLGYGADKPDTADLDPKMRERNSTWFFNVQYTFYKHFQTGLEFQSIQTEYKPDIQTSEDGTQATEVILPSGKDFKVHFMLAFNF
ncbi:MAG: hypothetical protein Kow0090_21260 [Myxococcota bacterium]